MKVAIIALAGVVFGKQQLSQITTKFDQLTGKNQNIAADLTDLGTWFGISPTTWAG